MDNSYPYIASLTREPFLFYEMRTTAKLMYSGLNDDEIVKQIVKQNLFQYPTEKSISRMARACIKRLHGLEDEMLVAGIASQPMDVFKTMDAIANAVSDSCEPAIIPDIALQTIDEKTVIVVEVSAGRQPRTLITKSKRHPSKRSADSSCVPGAF